MKIITLMENDSIDMNLKHAHGLSLYIEWKKHKILFDLGPNKHFYTNAKTLGIDIEEVDTVIISHGHFDHGIGLQTFLKHNDKAKIYLSDKAFNKQTKKIGIFQYFIGIKKPKTMDNIVLVNEDIEIEPGFKIHTKVPYKKRIIGDTSLYTKKDGNRVLDEFDHEIYLTLKENKHNVLISGCSHKGIENIIDNIEAATSTKFTEVIGGFHLNHYNPENNIETEYLKELGEYLIDSRNTKYYSCHCTGDVAFKELNKEMHDKLERIKTGSVIEIK